MLKYFGGIKTAFRKPITAKRAKEKLLQNIIDHFLGEKKEKRIIIFCETKREVKEVSSSDSLKLTSGTLHGDMKHF